MVSQARSQRLIMAHVEAGGNSPAFVCPGGTTTLVKSMYTYNRGTVEALAHLVLVRGSDQLGQFIHNAKPAVGLEDEWQGWAVLHPTDAAWVYCETGSIGVWVSGAILAGAPLFPPAENAVPLIIPPSIVSLPF